jgi:hypothetical protein
LWRAVTGIGVFQCRDTHHPAILIGNQDVKMGKINLGIEIAGQREPFNSRWQIPAHDGSLDHPVNGRQVLLASFT